MQTASDQLVSAFETVGYEKVNLHGCGVAFVRRFEPTDTNSGLFAYWRHLDISSIQNLPEAQVEVKELSNRPDFLLTLQYNDAYWERYSQVVRFDSWVASTYPESNWPYQFPSSHDEHSSLIEYEIHQRVDVIQVSIAALPSQGSVLSQSLREVPLESPRLIPKA